VNRRALLLHRLSRAVDFVFLRSALSIGSVLACGRERMCTSALSPSVEGVEQVTEKKQDELPTQQTQDHEQRCPACAASPQLIASTLDVKTGKTIRLFHCTQCGENWAY
jgi:formate dehydrogenase maturation protein FdhE